MTNNIQSLLSSDQQNHPISSSECIIQCVNSQILTVFCALLTEIFITGINTTHHSRYYLLMLSNISLDSNSKGN